MIIYLCIKFGSNTLIFSKDIEPKPFFKVESRERAITPKIIGAFYPNNSRDSSVGSEVCLTTSYTPLPCRFESSWGHDDQVCVNGCSSLPVAVVSQGISQSLYNWKLPRLSSTTELSSEIIVRYDWFRVIGRKKKSNFNYFLWLYTCA